MGHKSSFTQVDRADNEGSDLLAFRQFGEPNHDDVSHALMLCDHGFDLGRVDIGATADNEVGATSQEA